MNNMNQKRKGPGRPRTRPEGTKKRALYLTDAEAERLRRRAEAAGLSLEEWMRRAVLAAK